MSAPKWILVGTVTLFSLIGIAAALKKRGAAHSENQTTQKATLPSKSAVISVPVKQPPVAVKEIPAKHTIKKRKGKAPEATPPTLYPAIALKEDFPNIDRVYQLFTTGSSKLPIVETLNYASSVSWLKGRPAWIADYATYFNTSRHFIARSLNGKADYFSQKVSEGSKFNVFRKDKNINFHLLVDVTRCKMGFYYVDLDTNERVLLKTYRVGLGRLDTSSPSGTLTPLGRFPLGSRVAIYKPGMTGLYQDKKVEMVKVFGSRWIPLDSQGEQAKGYGLQGAPWTADSATGQWVENKGTIGAYDSDGCIRLSSADIEELFSIVLTKPTLIEIVKDFHEAKLPGLEVAAPSR